MIFIGKVSNGTILLPPGAHLPEGAEVEVRPIAAKGNGADFSTDELTDELVRLSADVHGLPTDLARNHDHYLHGLPKR
ncbi:MAG: hypothetical protein ACREH8_11035 [Opitutaceae bacterium]